MRVDRKSDIGGVAAHFDRECRLGDQIARIRADDAGADDSMRLFVEEQLGQAFITPERQRASIRRPRERRLFVLDATRLRVGLGQAHPCDLGIRVGHRRNHARIEESFLAMRHFGCELALVRCLVCQHRLTCDIADRENVRHVRAHLTINRNEAALVDDDAGRFGVDALAVRAATYRDQHFVIELRFGSFLALEGDLDAVLLRFEFGHLGLHQDLLIALGNALLERTHQIAIAAGNQPVGQFDDADFGAERRIDRGHLEADNAAADDQQTFRQIELECAGGIDDARIVRQARQFDALGTCRDDAVCKRDFAPALLRRGLLTDRSRGVAHFDLVRRYEHARAANDLHLALLRHHREPAGEASHDLALPFEQLRRFDLRLAEVDAVNVHFFGFFDHLRGMQQRFRRNASDVETYAAERRPTLDQRHFHAEIGRTKRGGVAARTGTEHDHVEVVFLSARLGNA